MRGVVYYNGEAIATKHEVYSHKMTIISSRFAFLAMLIETTVLPAVNNNVSAAIEKIHEDYTVGFLTDWEYETGLAYLNAKRA